jgi:SulP family sulfate permease
VTNKREAVVFFGAFLSVLFLDLFGAVLVGAALAIAYSKWEQAHPNVSLAGNVLKIRGNIYYGSLPVIERIYHDAIARGERLVIDFSQAYYIDPEGLRWLASAKSTGHAALIDRRSGIDRRAVAAAAAAAADRRSGWDRRTDGRPAAPSERRARRDRRRKPQL